MDSIYTELYEKLSTLQWLLGRYRMMNHAERGPFADTSRGQGRVLAMLKIQPEISTKDLSYLLGIRVPSLNELLCKLEKGGFITRQPSETDKRVMLISLTEKGKTAELGKNDYSDIFNGLTEDDLRSFEQYLDKIIASLEANYGAEPDEDQRARWAQSARSRMGDEQFKRMMHMRNEHFRHHCAPHGRERGPFMSREEFDMECACHEPSDANEAADTQPPQDITEQH